MTVGDRQALTTGGGATQPWGMKTAAALSCLVALLLSLPAEAKPKGCFSPNEINAERLVRQGLRLREGATGCDGNPWNFGTLSMWRDIDQRFGQQFAQQTKIRKGAFVREFDKDAENRITQWDGRTVMHYRGYPLSVTYCTEIKKLLSDMQKSGWAAFKKRAVVAPDDVKFMFKSCG